MSFCEAYYRWFGELVAFATAYDQTLPPAVSGRTYDQNPDFTADFLIGEVTYYARHSALIRD